MRELPGWEERASRVHGRATVASPATYYDLFAPVARSIDIWRTRYEQVMDGVDAIVEWVRGSGRFARPR